MNRHESGISFLRAVTIAILLMIYFSSFSLPAFWSDVRTRLAADKRLYLFFAFGSNERATSSTAADIR